jgi:hypothetical protein
MKKARQKKSLHNSSNNDIRSVLEELDDRKTRLGGQSMLVDRTEDSGSTAREDIPYGNLKDG